MCFIKSLKIIKIIYQACVDFQQDNNDLIDDNIYYLDYSHISNELKGKNELKKLVLDLSYDDLFNNLNNYLLNSKKKIIMKMMNYIIMLLISL
jgi:hypothetical protein